MSITLPNMNLLSPVVGDTDYPTSVTTSLANIDDHDHTSGNGVQIPTGGITNLAIDSTKLASNAVTTAKITDLNVTRAKLAAVGQQISAAVTVSKALIGASDVAGLTVTITTTGRPVFVSLCGNSTGGGCDVQNARTSPTTVDIPVIKFVRDATTIANFRLGTLPNPFPATSMNISYPVGGFFILDPVAAGTYVYKVQTESCAAANTVEFVGVKLLAYEL